MLVFVLAQICRYGYPFVANGLEDFFRELVSACRKSDMKLYAMMMRFRPRFGCPEVVCHKIIYGKILLEFLKTQL